MQQLPLPFSTTELYGDTWEYLLLTSPSPYVADRVMEEKEHFSDNYKHSSIINTWPHITIANFKTRQKLEHSVIEITRKACISQKRFVAILKDFDGFEPSTLYIKIENQNPFLELSDRLRGISTYLHANECPYVSLVSTPHMTIARRIPPKLYTKVMEEYAERSFNDSFTVESLVLVKRRHKLDNYRHVTTFKLSSIFSSTKPNQYAKSNHIHSRLQSI